MRTHQNAVHSFMVSLICIGWPLVGQAGESVRQPLILRISTTALQPLGEQAVDYRAKVHQVSSGTQVNGSSHTTGSVVKQVVTDRDRASLLATFDGQASSRTVGYNGPAIIHSHTQTKFVCSRHISFEPRAGFTAGPCCITAQTSLTHDGFGSTRRGVAGLVIRRAARKRALESHAQSQQIAAREIAGEIRRTFDRRLDAELDRLNERINIARVVNTLYGEDARLKFSSRSDRDCIQLGISQEGSPACVYEPPTRWYSDAPAEIWVHSTLVGLEGILLADTIDRVERDALLAAAKLAMQSAIPAAQDLPETHFDIAISGEWFVIALRNEPPPDANGSSSPQEESSP